MNICSECKHYLEDIDHCKNIYNILSKHKYYKDPITGSYNSVYCREFNSNGKCIRFEKPLLTPIGIYIILLVLCILFIMFLIGVSVGQHLG